MHLKISPANPHKIRRCSGSMALQEVLWCGLKATVTGVLTDAAAVLRELPVKLTLLIRASQPRPII
jgi:hypothetical protein